MDESLHKIEAYIKEHRKCYRDDKLYLSLLCQICQGGDFFDERVFQIIHSQIGTSDEETQYPLLEEGLLNLLVIKKTETVRVCIEGFVKSSPGHFMKTPESVVQLCINCVNPQNGEFVYLPFCGLSSEAVMLPHDIRLYGEELDELIWALGQIRLWSVGLNANGIQCGDSYATLLGQNPLPAPPDIIIMQPPYATNTLHSAYSDDMIIAIEKGLELLSENGRMALVVPNSISVGIKIREFRKRLLPNIATVVSLQEKMSFTGVKFLMVVISKQVTDRISLTDGNKHIELQKTQLEDCNFLPRYYLDNIEIRSKHPLVKLIDFIEKVELEYLRNEDVVYVDLRSLSQTIDDCLLKKTALVRHAPESWKMKKQCKLSEKAMLVSNGLPMRVALFEPTADMPAICLNTNVLTAYRIKDNKKQLLKEYYLLSTLLSDDITCQIQLKTTYPAYNRSVFLKELLRYRIPLPSVSEQESIVRNSVLSTLSDVQRRGVETLTEMLQRQSHMRHYLGNVFSQLSSKLEKLNNFRKRNGGVLHDNDSLSHHRQNTVADQFEDIMTLTDFIGEVISSMRDYRSDFPMEDINLNVFLQNFVRLQTCSIIDFTENIDDAEVRIRFSRPALDCICLNIITNALRHGFGGTINPQHDLIRVRWFVEKNAVVLEIANNGTPLTIAPEKVLELGKTTNAQKGEGIGGNDIYNYMKAGGGEVEVISMPDDEFTVTYRLQFNNITTEAPEDE